MKIQVLDSEATGRRIKELREERHMKVAALAEMLGLESVQAIYKWQRAESMPSIDNLVVLSGLFGVPIDNIIMHKVIEEGESPLSCIYGANAA